MTWSPTYHFDPQRNYYSTTCMVILQYFDIYFDLYSFSIWFYISRLQFHPATIIAGWNPLHLRRIWLFTRTNKHLVCWYGCLHVQCSLYTFCEVNDLIIYDSYNMSSLGGPWREPVQRGTVWFCNIDIYIYIYIYIYLSIYIYI